jgi:hypothetical protein
VRKLWTLPRHPGDALRLVVGLAILLACTATVRPNDVGVLETDLFRLANDLPDALFPAFFVVMQAGNVLAVGVAAVVVAATRRFWLAVNLAITGIGVWLLARPSRTGWAAAGRSTCSPPCTCAAATTTASGSCPGTPPWPWPSPP